MVVHLLCISGSIQEHLNESKTHSLSFYFIFFLITFSFLIGLLVSEVTSMEREGKRLEKGFALLACNSPLQIVLICT